jgi:hypothetical protein
MLILFQNFIKFAQEVVFLKCLMPVLISLEPSSSCKTEYQEGNFKQTVK